MSRHLLSVDPSDDDESTLGGKKSDGDESPVSVDPSDDASLLSSVDPLPELHSEFSNIIEHPSLLSSVDPLAYMNAEAGKIIEIIIKNINEIVIRFIDAIESE